MSVSFIGRFSANSYITVSANNKAVSKFTLSEAGKAFAIGIDYYVYRWAYVKGVIYADNGGSPGALLGVTEEIYGNASAVVFYNFAEPISLSPGDYHIGLISGGDYVTVEAQTLTGTNTRNSDTYSDGPSDPFGTPGTALTSELCVTLHYVAGANQDVTKAYGAAVLVPDDIEITKTVGFAVIAPNDHRIFKAVSYAVIEEVFPNLNTSSMFVIT